jgi:hypothetical protein
MKRTFVTAALVAWLVVPAGAATTTWQGDMFITAISETSPGVSCKAVGLGVGDFARGVFRPKSVAGNGTSDLLAWHFARNAGQLAPTTPAGGALNGATAATIRIIFGSAGFQQFTGAAISGVVVSPAAPTAATAAVTIQITINNAYSSAPATPSGCNITFKGTLGRRLS